ncbi:MAG: hypothetical protein CVV46_05175 [Spirochaetae bacterium HGW-Spirochaetae-2]|jgi:EAL domain-containing protein (putative c-di-GMP-specific phosphodiesterase class I)/PAS domain-containing protein|nr:MAG: hypothetical protein CVV46_05175 [Spirochaetae bacterium HGW-Spirochaetae-2]
MKRLIWNITKRFLVILPIAVLFLFMYAQLVTLEQQNAREKVISEHTGHLKLMEYMVNNVFEEYYSTLHLIRNSNEMVNYLADPSDMNRKEVEAFFTRMSDNRPYINGLSLGSDSGEPIFGLTAFGGIRSTVYGTVPFPGIWYEMVSNVVLAPEQGFYFSPLTYVVPLANGGTKIPVIGTSIPVYTAGAVSATISMLVDGNHILSMIERFLIDHPSEIRYGLADSKGNWILRTDGSHMRSYDSQENPLVREAPELWNQIVRSNFGEASMNGMNYHFHSFDPFADASAFYETHPHFLVGVMSFADDDVTVLEDSFLLRNRPLRWVLAVLILLLGGFINLLAYFRRNDRELLAVSNLVSDQSHDGVVITDTMMQVTYCNRTFESMTGFSNDEILSGMHDIRALSGEEFESAKVMRLASVQNQSIESWQGFLWVIGKRHCALTHLSVSSISNNQGHAIHTVELYSNPRNLSKESFEKMVLAQDQSTNEMDIYPLQLLETKKSRDKGFVSVYLKLLNIDLIEAQYSLDEHYVLGAQIRERIAQALQKDDLMIQYSPDTFLLAMHVSDHTDPKEIAMVQKVFDEPFGLRDKKQLVRIRSGVSAASPFCPDAAAMLRQCRMALAAQDHFERNGALVYDKTVDEHLLRYYAILQAFPGALAKRQLKVNFQPVVDVSTNMIRGAEALIRWNHPTLGALSPVEFIPIVEQNHLERSLGKYVVEQVVCFLNELQEKSFSQIGISMNLCPTELQDADLVPHMVRTLKSYGVDHDRLMIELTERTLLTDLEAANSVLEELHDEKIQVAIDDFGTGFSSLSYLHELDVDTLKIDRSFIKDYPGNDDGVILKAMVGMAKELAIPVLVEGIESFEQLEFLKSLGVSAYQGFLFSRAVDEKGFMDLLNR